LVDKDEPNLMLFGRRRRT